MLRDIRIDLICGISAYHVLDWFLSTGVKLEKGVYLQDTALEDNDMFPICNQALDIAAAQHSVLARRSGGGFLHGGRVLERQDLRKD